MSDNPAPGPDCPGSHSARGRQRRFRLPPRGAGRESRAGARGVRQRRAALRPDERPDVAGRASRVEAHLRHGAGPQAARYIARSGRRHRRYRVRLAGEGRRPGAAVGYQRVDAGCGAGSRSGTQPGGRVSLLVADAEHVPLPDRSVDRVSIAFGLRNCTDKAAVLREARRVLKPGGRFGCLEFSAFRWRCCSRSTTRGVFACCRGWGAWWRRTRTATDISRRAFARSPTRRSWRK